MIDSYMAIVGVLCKMPNQTATAEQISETLLYSEDEVLEMLKKLCVNGSVVCNTSQGTYSISEDQIPLVPEEKLKEFISARKGSR